MNQLASTLIVIPSRMAASRLPGKPLADIAGVPMIVHVWRAAMQAALGPVLVAAAEPEIAQAVMSAGGEAILTAPELPSGSDRVFAALTQWEARNNTRADIVINLQGDLPTISPHVLSLVRDALVSSSQAEADIATLAAAITTAEESDNPNVVKAIVSFENSTPKMGDVGRALYFTRARAPSGEGMLLHHIGIYAYRRKALERFVALEPSALEKREKLEQLRALEAGMHINVGLVDTVPLGVDTPADLEKARAHLRKT